jgi:hypothetical protein
LILAGAPQWAPRVFEGVLLILAVSLTRSAVHNPLSQLKNAFERRRGGSTDGGARPGQTTLQGG